MINDIFKVFGEQTGEILFEIIKDCMDDYLYIFDLQNDTFEISQSAVERFNMSKNVLTDAPNLKLLLRDIRLSDDISLRFNNSSWDGYPLFADTYINEIAALPQEEQIINIFMELSALGIAQPLSSNILEFFKALPECARQKGITFSTPSEICKKMKSVGELNVPDTLSWVDEERDVSPWLGNQMQREAFNKLYSVADRVRIANDPRINQDWDYLQASNNFRFMTTKPSNVGLDRGIYSSPFDAFTNYMNILGDFLNRVNSLHPEMDNEQLDNYMTSVTNMEEEIEMKDKEITRLQAKLDKIEKEVEKLREAQKPAKTATKKAATKKAAAKTAAKPAAKKTTDK